MKRTLEKGKQKLKQRKLHIGPTALLFVAYHK